MTEMPRRNKWLTAKHEDIDVDLENREINYLIGDDYNGNLYVTIPLDVVLEKIQPTCECGTKVQQFHYEKCDKCAGR